MADRPPDSDTEDDAGTPRWVKVSGVIVAVLVVLVGIMLLASYRSGRHFSLAGASGDMPGSQAPAADTP